MPHQRLDQIRSKLTNQDKETLKGSVGLELDECRLNAGVFAGYELHRSRASDARITSASGGGVKHGLRCSFCQKYVTEIGHIMKLSDSHVMCDLCIEFLVDTVRQGT